MSNYDRDEERRQERLMRVEELFELKKQLDKDAQDPRVSDNLASTISKLESTIFKHILYVKCVVNIGGASHNLHRAQKFCFDGDPYFFYKKNNYKLPMALHGHYDYPDFLGSTHLLDMHDVVLRIGVIHKPRG